MSNNYWIIGEKHKRFHSRKFEKLEDAKFYCVKEFKHDERKELLNGGNILHVVDGKIISMIDIMYINKNLLFSDVHILHNPIEFDD